jgi:hypothetical protein
MTVEPNSPSWPRARPFPGGACGGATWLDDIGDLHGGWFPQPTTGTVAGDSAGHRRVA